MFAGLFGGGASSSGFGGFGTPKSTFGGSGSGAFSGSAGNVAASGFSVQQNPNKAGTLIHRSTSLIYIDK